MEYLIKNFKKQDKTYIFETLSDKNRAFVFYYVYSYYLTDYLRIMAIGAILIIITFI